MSGRGKKIACGRFAESVSATGSARKADHEKEDMRSLTYAASSRKVPAPAQWRFLLWETGIFPA